MKLSRGRFRQVFFPLGVFCAVYAICKYFILYPLALLVVFAAPASGCRSGSKRESSDDVDVSTRAPSPSFPCFGVIGGVASNEGVKSAAALETLFEVGAPLRDTTVCLLPLKEGTADCLPLIGRVTVFCFLLWGISGGVESYEESASKFCECAALAEGRLPLEDKDSGGVKDSARNAEAIIRPAAVLFFPGISMR